jgi:hypothetical protein
MFGRISALIITVSISITISAMCTAEMDSYALLTGQRSERKKHTICGALQRQLLITALTCPFMATGLSKIACMPRIAD